VILHVRAPLVATLLLLCHVYFGAGWALGPPRLMSSGSFAIARDIASPTAWGWALLAGAALCLATGWVPKWPAVLLRVAAAAPLAGLAGSTVLADVLGLSQGWGGPILFGAPVLLHAWIIRARLTHTDTPGGPGALVR
jgi:hypothetical protein